MGMDQTSKFCPVCQKPTLWARPTTNHVLHLLIFLFFCGLWLPVWIMASMRIGGWRCQTCGYRGSLLPRLVPVVVCVLLFLGVVLFLGSLVGSANRGMKKEPVYPVNPPDPSRKPILPPPVEPGNGTGQPGPVVLPPVIGPTDDGGTAPPPPPKEPEFRTWTDSTGKFKIEAEFAGMELGKAKLKKKDGTVIQLPLEKLSDDDQEWIKHRIEQPPDESPPKVTQPPDEKSPLSMGSLSGTWQASAGATFRINDDGTTATVQLTHSTPLQEFSGKLSRGDKGPDSKSLTGILNAVFIVDAPRRYAIHVTATLDDQDHLRLRCADWPVWNNRGNNLGTRTLNETWTRQ